MDIDKSENVKRKCEGNIPALFQSQEINDFTEDENALYNEWSCEITCEFIHEVDVRNSDSSSSLHSSFY